MADERDLLRKARKLEEATLGTIFDMYYQPLYRYIYHQVGHTETAEDLVTEVFKRFLEGLSKGRGPKRHLQAWLYQVARNLIADEFRRNAHHNHSQLDDHLADANEDIESQTQGAILGQHAKQALKHLTPKQRDVIILKFFEGLENAQIAQIMNLEVGSVKSLQHRGLAALRRHLTESGVTPGEIL